MDFRNLFLSCVVLAVGATAQRACPPAASILPCTCETYSAIYCGPGEIPFAQVFKALEAFADQTDQNYHWDYVQFFSTTNIEIPADAFGNITFRALAMNENSRLSKINPAAFSNMENKFEFAYFMGSPNLKDADELFLLLSSIQSLNRIDISRANYNKIPANAFKAQLKLETILFNTQTLESIGSHAFYELDNLMTLLLQANKFTGTPTIDPRAFEFKTASTQDLFVSLYGFGLTPAVLDPINFSGFNGRNVTLDLGNNGKITYLNENTFQPFLNANPGNQLQTDFLGDCTDCKLAWLVKNNLVDTRVVVSPSEYGPLQVQCLLNGEYVNLADQIFSQCKD